jgi:fucose permease
MEINYMITTLLLVIIYASFISLGLPDSLLGSAWPSMHLDLNVSVSYAGAISMMVAGGTIISSFFSVKIIRRFGTGKVTAISVLMTALALLGFSISRNVVFLFIFSIPLGLGAGSVDAALNNFVALHYKARHMSWLHCFWGIGATIGPIIMSYWLGKSDWSSGYRTIGFIQLSLAVILFMSLPIWGKVDKGQSNSSDDENSDLGLRELLKVKGAKFAFLSFFFYCSLESTCGLWGSSFMVFNRGISPEVAARMISLFYMGITFGRFISGFLMIKISTSKMIRIGQGILVVAVILVMLPLKDMFLGMALFLIGVGCAPVFPCLIHQTPEKFGSKISQAMIGVQMACAYASTTFMPPLFGLIADNISIALYPYFLFVALIFMIIMTEALRKTASNV